MKTTTTILIINNNNNNTAYCSHHTTQRFNSVLFRDFFVAHESQVPERLRCLATPAFDFNFFELLTLGIFTTEGVKIKFKKI